MSQLPRTFLRALALVFTLSVVLGSARQARAATLVGGPVTTNTTWTLAASPYEVTSTVTVTNHARLTIEAGVVVRFRPSTALQIGHPKFDVCESTCNEVGRLSVLGTALKPVLFTSKSGLRGGWRGLSFGPASDVTEGGALVSFLTVERAGQPISFLNLPTPNISLLETGEGFSWNNVSSVGGTGDGFRLTDSELQLSLASSTSNDGAGIRALRSTVEIAKSTISANSLGGLVFREVAGSVTKSTITENTGAGIELEDSAELFTNQFQLRVASNEISANTSYAVTFFFKNRPIITGNTLRHNGSPGIRVVGGTAVVPAPFSKQNGESNFDVVEASIVLDNNNELVIEPGCVVRFARFTGLEIGEEPGSHGKLIANGTSTAPILFTAHVTDPGSWFGLRFAPNVIGQSSLENVIIENAGQAYAQDPLPDGAGAAVYVHGSGDLFDSWTNVTVRESAGHGMYLDDARLSVVGGSYSSNALTGIFVDGAVLDLAGAEMSDNGDVGLLLFSDATDAFVHDCLIEGNGSDGVFVFASPSILTGNTISGNEGYGLRYQLNRSTEIFGNILAANFFPGVLGEGSSLTRNEVWSPQTGEPFLTLNDEITVSNSAELRIEAGLTAMFPSGGGLRIGYPDGDCIAGSAPSCVPVFYGRLTLQGSALAPVVLTSTAGTPGSWRGVSFGPVTDQGSLSKMEYAIVEHAGQPRSSLSPATALGGAITLIKTSAILNNLTVASSTGPGIVSDTSSPLVKNSVVAFNEGAGLHAMGGGAPSFSFGVLHQNAANVAWLPAASTLNVDPMFVDPVAGNYVPAPGSPCIDSGTSVGLPFFGAAPNRGAIE